MFGRVSVVQIWPVKLKEMQLIVPDQALVVMRVETTGGNKIEINDVWTTRILDTAVSGTGIYVVKSLVTFFRENQKLVTDAVKMGF